MGSEMCIRDRSIIRELQAIDGPDAEDQMRKLIEEYKTTGSHTAIAEKAKASGGSKKAPAASAATKRHTAAGGIKLQATGKKLTNAVLEAALEEWLNKIRNDGRGRRAA